MVRCHCIAGTAQLEIHTNSDCELWKPKMQDSARLPEGMRRVGYDADSRQYTFLDEKGALYQSDPGNRYGVLRPTGTHAERAEKQRPTMFEGTFLSFVLLRFRR